MYSPLLELFKEISEDYCGNKFTCPFCKSKPLRPLMVKGRHFECLLCKVSGDYHEALRRYENMLRDENLGSIGAEPKVEEIVDGTSAKICLDYFEFHQINEEILDLYSISIRGDIVYYPCSDNNVVFHKVLSIEKIQWMHVTNCNVFGLTQIDADCKVIYVTDSVIDVLLMRSKDINAIALLNFVEISEGISELPKNVDKYVFCCDESRFTPIIEYLLHQEEIKQKFVFFTEKDGTKLEVEYDSYIEIDVLRDKDHVICFKKADAYRKMARYAATEIRQRVNIVLDYAIDTLKDRTYPIEDTESALIELALKDVKYIDNIMICYSFFHKDTQAILDYVKEMRNNPRLTPAVVNRALLTSNNDNLRSRYKLLSDLFSEVDESLLESLLFNLTFYGSKRKAQHLKYESTDDPRDSFKKLRDSYTQIGGEVEEVLNAISGTSFDYEKCIDGNLMDAYQTELAETVRIFTGFPFLDENLYFTTSAITTIIGHSGEGKSVALINLLIELAKNNPDRYILWLDLEMTLPNLQDRMYRIVSGKVGEVPPGWEDDYPYIKKILLVAGDRPWAGSSSVDLPSIMSNIRRMIILLERRGEKLSMVAIDHIHQIGGIGSHDTATIMKNVSIELYKFARAQNISVVLVAQLNKHTGQASSYKDLVPGIDDISFGGALKRATDSCISVCDIGARVAEAKHFGLLKKGFDRGPDSLYEENRTFIQTCKLRSGKGGAAASFKCNKAAYFVDFSSYEIAED